MMEIILFLVVFLAHLPTLYYVLKLQKLKNSKDEWGFLTDEEQQQWEHDMALAVLWGTIYASLLLFCTVHIGKIYSGK